MWTATVKNKEQTAQGYKVTVDFTDGNSTSTETCIPQDLNGFKHWVKGRLQTFNCEADIDANYDVDSEVVFTEPTLTQDEIDFREWLSDFGRLQTVQKLIDLGIVANDNAKVVALRTKLTNNIKVDYIDLF